MEDYSVQEESAKLLFDGILNNPLHSSLPAEVKDAAKHVEFVGSKSPSVPVNWRFAESMSSLKAFEASVLGVLLKRKYGVDYQRVVINTDHAQLFFMSISLPVIDPEGKNIKVAPTKEFFEVFGPDTNLHNQRLLSPCSNIYKTKDNRDYHVHGGVNHSLTQKALGVTEEEEYAPWEDALQTYKSKVAQYTAEELDAYMNDVHKQSGTICYTKEDFPNTPHGKANSHVGLYEVHHVPHASQAPVWWATPPSGPSADASRPLFGLKVIDLTRMIASPVITRELAEMGASVLRITAAHITDLAPVNVDVMWGKWSAHLDLRREEHRKRLRELIEEADVVVDGYRPGVMDKYGFGKDDILGFFKDKERGIVHCRENCYGWYGPWAHRSGWQSISDVNVGVAHEFGRAMGLEESVLPGFPNADFCTGVAGATGILEALIARSSKGGSYVVDIALNYYSTWLVRSCGTYPPAVWSALWTKYDRFTFRHFDNMGILMPAFLSMLRNAPIHHPDFYELRENKAIGYKVYTPKPVLSFPDGPVRLGYNVGCRPNGTDEPRWPEDLMTEIIA